MNCLQFCWWTVFNSVGELSSKCVLVNCPVCELSRFLFEYPQHIFCLRKKKINFQLHLISRGLYFVCFLQLFLTLSFMNIHAKLHPLWIIINFHVGTENKEITCQIHKLRIISKHIFMSKQSYCRSYSGSSCKSCQIWVCSLCKSIIMCLYGVKGWLDNRTKCLSSGLKKNMQGLPWLRICCSQHFSQMEKVGAKWN